MRSSGAREPGPRLRLATRRALTAGSGRGTSYREPATTDERIATAVHVSTMVLERPSATAGDDDTLGPVSLNGIDPVLLMARVSLAEAGRRVGALGRLDRRSMLAPEAEIPADLVAETDSPVRRLRRVAPPARLSVRAPSRTRPRVPTGTHEPAWPACAQAAR